MLLRTGLFALAAALLVPAVAAAASWKTYVNDRFGSTAEVPSDWRGGEASANGDGFRFLSPDGQAWIVVSGGLHVWSTIDEAVAILETPDEGEQITYRHRETRMIVISGAKRDRIFYRKSILSCRDTVWNSVAVEYPASKKQAFDLIVSQVAKSLRPGKGEQAAECNGLGSSSRVTLVSSQPAAGQASGRQQIKGSGATARNANAQQATAYEAQGNDATTGQQTPPSDQDMQRSDDNPSSHSDM